MEIITLDRGTKCADCGLWLPAGTEARKFGDKIYCRKPHPDKPAARPPAAAPPGPGQDLRAAELDHFLDGVQRVLQDIRELVQEYIELSRR